MKDIDENLAGYLSGKRKAKLSNISVEFRILNGYFPNQYRANTIKTSTIKNKFTDLLPKGRTFKDIRKNAVKLINENYNISIA